MKTLIIKRKDKLLVILKSDGDKLIVVETSPHWEEAMQRIAERGIAYPKHFPLSKYNASPNEPDKLICNIQGLYETTLGGLTFEWGE